MPRLNGKDKSTLPRGLKSTKAERGVCGAWLGIPKAVWHEKVEHQVFVLPSEEKTYVMLVPKWCREAVFYTMGATFSWSNHAASRAIVSAMTEGTRPNYWHMGIVTVRVANGVIHGISELHTEKPKQEKAAPWKGPEYVHTEDHGRVVVMEESESEQETIRL